MPSQRIIIPIVPKGDFPKNVGDGMLKELETWMRGRASTTLKTAFMDTVEGWDHKPEFPAEYSTPFGTQMEVYVHPKGTGTTNWQRVSDGTGPRSIVSSKGVMHYQTEYTPHTNPPRKGGSWGGPGSRGGEWRHARVINNHRIEPREFSKEIAKKYGAKLVAEAEAIIAKALK